MAIDFNNDIGKVRLRIGDVNDLPFLNDTVIQNAITEKQGNLPAAAQVCAMYILGQLAFRGHKKMAQMEIWGADVFNNYRTFLMDTVSNPSLMSFTGIPVLIGSVEKSSLQQLTEDWNKNWTGTTVSQRMHSDAGYDELPGELG